MLVLLITAPMAPKSAFRLKVKFLFSWKPEVPVPVESVKAMEVTEAVVEAGEAMESVVVDSAVMNPRGSTAGGHRRWR
ncbi:hypothetical protein [Nonomuraea jabiensis]|uniref:hypothetical protein n=1 Tax=Nonomuraea jabiensis TaxID=882448 RepID=UPI003D747F42